MSESKAPNVSNTQAFRMSAKNSFYDRIERREKVNDSLRMLYTVIPWDDLDKYQEELLWDFFTRNWDGI